MSTVAVLHPGQMGAALARQLILAGHRVLWVPDGRSEATAHRAAKAGLIPATSLRSALEESELALGICPPAAAEDLAARVAETGFAGTYVEANAVSPVRVHAIEQSISSSGVALVDGCVIGPPPSSSATARLYLAGDVQQTKAVSDLFAGTQVTPVVLNRETGAASALKMAFAGFQKPARVLAALAHALADTHGVGDELVAEATAMPSDVLADRDYLSSVAPRAWRWGPELEEIARTQRAAGLLDDMALGTVRTMRAWDHLKGSDNPAIGEVLDSLRVQPATDSGF
ncbi:DUF1932 domain-containing protein [Kitasatospora sp. NPDC094028]